jgi:CubicO group peptidase (beta-lactamase class C family)
MTADLLQAARPLLQKALRQQVGSAVAVGVVTPAGQQVWADGRTSAVRLQPGPLPPQEPRPGLPIGPNNLFDLASLTKPMVTTTLFALLFSEALPRLSPGDRLATRLPEAKGTALGEATLLQLLGHASGAEAWCDFAQQTADLTGNDRVRALRQAVLHTPLVHPPGQKAVYSDLGFLALGWVLERLLNQSLADAFAQRIAKPLGLLARYLPATTAAAASTVVATEVWPPRCPTGLPLQGVVHDDNAAALGGVAGHAGLFGSITDVLTWAEVWLAATAPDQRPCDTLPLSRDVCRKLVGTAMAPATSWRCGWDTPSQPGSTAGSLAPPDTFGHLGFTGTSIWLSPGRHCAIALLTNRVHPSRHLPENLPPDQMTIRTLRPQLYDAIWSRAFR